MSVVIVLPIGDIQEENIVGGKEAPKQIEVVEFIPQNFSSFEIMMTEDLNVQKIVSVHFSQFSNCVAFYCM
jgi:hypothetical protein